MMTDAQKKAMRTDRSLCVTAGAGAGKTYTLVQRYIRLIESGVQVQRILALTFTDKAAAEMKHKVRKEILKMDGEMWEKVKDDLNWCNISTFHSFCAEIIREFPLETGVAPGFDVLMDVRRDELLGEAMDALMVTKDDAIANALVRLLTDVPKGKLFSGILYIYGRRTEMMPFLDSFSSKEELLAEWKVIANEGRKKAVESFLQDHGFMSAIKDLRSLTQDYSGDKDVGTRYLKTIAPMLEDIEPDAEIESICQALLALRSVKGRRGAGIREELRRGPK